MFNSDNFDEKQYFHSYAPANPQYCYETAVFYEAPSFDAFVVEPKPGVLLDQERYLPIANVSRIMKSMIHPSGKLAKEAKECVQESVSEFIAFLASEAAEKCNREKRKTITADDLLNALRATGFGNYVDPLRIFLDKYREAFRITAPANQPHRHYAVTLPMEANGPQMMATAYISTESTTGDAQTITLPAGYTIAQQQLAGAPTVATNTFTTADGTTFVVVDAEEQQSFSLEGAQFCDQYGNPVVFSTAPEIEPQQIVIADCDNEPSDSTSRVRIDSDGQQISHFSHLPMKTSLQQIQHQTQHLETETDSQSLQGFEKEPQEEQVIQLDDDSQAVQIYVDPTTKQHYAAIDGPNGTQLYAVVIASEGGSFTFRDGLDAQAIESEPGTQLVDSVPETCAAETSNEQDASSSPATNRQSRRRVLSSQSKKESQTPSTPNSRLTKRAPGKTRHS